MSLVARLRRTLAAVALVAGLTLGGARSHAQPADVALRAAEVFDEGLARKEAGDWAGACAAFTESERLAPAVTVKINLAECARHAGDLLKAAAILREAITAAQAKGDRVRGDKAQLDLTAVVALTPLIAFDLAPAPGLTATIDGVTVADLAVAVPVNPGRHAVVVTANGTVVVQREVMLGPSAIERIGPVEPAPVVVAPIGPTPTYVDPLPPAPRRAGRPRRYQSAAIGLGVGAIGLAGGGAYLLDRAYRLTDDAEAACPDDGSTPCDAARANALWADGVTQSRIGVAALIGAGVVTGAAVALWWYGRPIAAVDVAPNAQGGSVVVRGWFGSVQGSVRTGQPPAG